MPLTVSDLDTLVTYFTGVMDRTHHAPNVDAIALALLGARRRTTLPSTFRSRTTSL
jgi:hypothetical protein